MEPLHYVISADDRKFLDAMIRDGRAMNNLLRETQNASSGIESALKKMGAAVGVSFGVAQIRNFAREVVSVRSQIQMLEQSFSVLLGSKSKADAMLVDIKEIALKSPLSLTDTSNAAQMLLSFNIAAEKVIPTLQMLGDISMGNNDRFRSLTLAFAQMSSAGKLMGQDLLQMINAGFNPLQVMSEKTGKSISALKDEMSKGVISSEMVADAFRSATAEGGKFYNMMEKQAEGIAGLQASLGDAWTNMFNRLGEKSEGVIEKGYKMTTALVENYEKAGKVLVALIATYGTYRAAVALNIAVEKGYTIAQLAHYNVLLLLEKAQKALNLAMSANPYILMATVIAGVATAMWALHDGTTAEEKAQKRLNDELEASKQKKNSLISKTNELVSVINDETQTVYTQIKAWNELKNAIPEAFAGMNIEDFKKLSLDDVKSRINIGLEKQDAAKLKEDIRLLEEWVSTFEKTYKTTRKRIAGMSDDAATLTNNSEAKANILYLKELNKEQEKRNQIRKEEEFQKKPAAERLAYYEEELRKLEEEKKKLERVVDISGDIAERWKSVNFETVINIDKLEKVNNKVNEIKGNISALEESANVEKYGVAYRDAKKDWDDAKKKLLEIEKDKNDFFTKEQYHNAVEREKATKKAYEDLGGDTSTQNAEKQRRDAEKIAEMRLRAERSIAERERELYVSREKEKLDREQKLLDIEKESFDKRMRQDKLNYNKELSEIEQQAAEKLKKAEEFAKDLYVKERGDDAGFNFKKFDYGKLPEDLRPENIKKWTEGANEIARDALKSANEETLKSLLEQYKSYTQQREDIEKKFNDDIASLRKEREDAEKEGNTAIVNRLTSAIAQATKNKGKELISFDFNLLRESPEYVRAFENLKNTSTETLNELLSQLETAKEHASSVLDPTELREYTSAIQSIIDELTSRNPFRALIASQRGLMASTKALAAARRELTAAQKSGNEERIKAAQEAYRNALNDTTEANNRAQDAQKSVNERMEELYGSLRGIGDVIGGQAGEIINLIADIGSFTNTIISSVQKAAAAGANGLATLEKASAILAIIQIAIQIISKLNELVADEHEEYEKFAAKLAEINKLRDAVGEYESAVIKARQAEEGWFAKDDMKTLRDAYDYNTKALENYEKKRDEIQAAYKNEQNDGWYKKWIEGGGVLGSAHLLMGDLIGAAALGYLGTRKDYDRETKKAMDNLRIETRKKSNGFLGSGIGGHSQKTEDLASWARAQGLGELFDKDGMINEELAKLILDKYNDKLAGETEATLEALVDLKEQYNEYLEQLHEYVSSLYAPLVDNMIDSLWDWFDEGKDALDSFKDYAADTFRDIVSDMLRTIILKNVVGTFQDDIADLYEQYAAGKITEEELMAKVAELTSVLVNDYKSQLPALQSVLDTVAKGFDMAGIDLKQTEDGISENTLKGSLAKASQESIDLLGGYMGALRKAVEQIYAILNERYTLPEGFVESVMGGMNAIPELIASGLHELIAIRELNVRIAASSEATVANTQKIGEISQRMEVIGNSVDGKLDSLADIADNTAAIGGMASGMSSAAGSLHNMERNVNVKFKGL